MNRNLTRQSPVTIGQKPVPQPLRGPSIDNLLAADCFAYERLLLDPFQTIVQSEIRSRRPFSGLQEACQAARIDFATLHNYLSSPTLLRKRQIASPLIDTEHDQQIGKPKSGG